MQSVLARSDWLYPQRNLNFEEVQRACTVSGLDNEEVSAYSVSVTRRAPIALGSQSAACSVKSIRGIWGVQCSKGGSKYLPLLSLSRHLSSGGDRPEDEA